MDTLYINITKDHSVKGVLKDGNNDFLLVPNTKWYNIL